MKVSLAAVLEPRAAERRKLVTGLRKAGLRVSDALVREDLGREGLVVLGPSVPRAAALAKAIRAAHPGALLVAAQRRGFKAAWADGVLPLPLSPNDLRLRVPEWARLRGLAKPAPSERGTHLVEGMLDPLTGFYTFTHFKEIVFVEVKRARRYGFPVAIALIALDPLPVAVEGPLQAQLMGGIALAIRRSLRDIDYPVQYGANRVLLLMPHTDLPGALIVSRRICERVARASLNHGDQVLRPTLSAGVSAATAKEGELSFAELATRAQTALETAVSAGGNQVQFGGALDVPSAPAPGEASGAVDPVTPRG